jgi:methylmalonyl-CoA/ethylmalonyl-CoA epimerase
MPPLTLGQIAINIKDLTRATAFYRDTLNLKLLFEVSGMAFFDLGGIRLMLTARQNPEATHSSILYYKTPDLHATAAALESKGITLESKPHLVAKMPDHELWMAFLRDTEGNLLGLMSEVR